MITKVVLPKSGMGIEDGTIGKWLKSVGDRVSQGETIAEIETAKAVEELQAPVSGTLVSILATEGETVPVNSEIALIEEGGLGRGR